MTVLICTLSRMESLSSEELEGRLLDGRPAEKRKRDPDDDRR